VCAEASVNLNPDFPDKFARILRKFGPVAKPGGGTPPMSCLPQQGRTDALHPRDPFRML
jgi:hypothetical protein